MKVVNRNDDYVMLVNNNGEIVYPLADKIEPVGEDIWAVYVDGFVGLLNEDGKFIVPPTHTFCGKFSHGLIKMKKHDAFRFYNKKGKVIVIEYCDEATDFDGQQITLTNHDVDEFTHIQQTHVYEIGIMSVDRPIKSKTKLPKINKPNHTNTADAAQDEDGFEQASFLD